jgi:hypothetical protein
MEEVLLAIVGGDEAEPALEHDFLDAACQHGGLRTFSSLGYGRTRPFEKARTTSERRPRVVDPPRIPQPLRANPARRRALLSTSVVLAAGDGSVTKPAGAVASGTVVAVDPLDGILANPLPRFCSGSSRNAFHPREGPSAIQPLIRSQVGPRPETP